MNQANTISALLEVLVPKKGKTKAEVARKLGISSQVLGQYISDRQKPKAEFYSLWKKTFGEDLMQMIETNVSRGQSSSRIEETEKGLTMQALVNLTESNRNQSESIKSISRSHEELVIMLKERNPTAGVRSRTELETVSTVLGMRRLLEQLAAKVNKQSLADVQDALDSMVMEELQNLEQHTGIVAADGRQSNG